MFFVHTFDTYLIDWTLLLDAFVCFYYFISHSNWSFSFCLSLVSRHHQDTVSLNSYSNNKICSGLNAIKSAGDIYDTRNLDNGQETCDSCDATTVYYPSIYATDPIAIGRLAAQQIIPNFLSTNNLTVKPTSENNYQESNEGLANNLSNSLGALLNANTISNTISSSNYLHSNQTAHDFAESPADGYCTNKNCTISGVLNKTDQMNSNLMNNKMMNCMNLQTNKIES